MIILTWIFITIDIVAVLAFIAMAMRGNQDAAGEAMLFLPILVIAAFAIGAWLLLKSGQTAWATVLAGFPAIIIIYLAYLHFNANKQE